MKRKRRIVVVGTFGNVPYAGMAWMHCQFLVGLVRLGHEVCYVETTTSWPYHPITMTDTDDPSYPVDYIRRVLDRFSFGRCWVYRGGFCGGDSTGMAGGSADR